LEGRPIVYHVTGLAFVFLTCLIGTSAAQTPTASIAGRVQDPSHAVIVGATVVAVNTDTNAARDVTTSGQGEFVLSSLAPGVYRVEVEKTGFRKLVRPGIIMHVGDALTLDVELTLGPLADAVTVEAGPTLPNTTSASVSTVVDREFVANLPLNGRSFQSLITMTPGVVVTPTAFDDQGQFSVNGQRANANYFTVDGVGANFGVTGYLPMAQSAGGSLPALSVAGGTNSLVSIDAMQEFRIQTSSFAPEFGRTPGGQISIVTRSGTNAFRGSVFEYFRNSALDANDWFVNANQLPKPEQRLNDFGGVFGGPLRKDTTFFFYSHESLRLREPSTQQTAVPDLPSRQQAPASMQPYLNAYPLPNGAAAGPGLASFAASYSNPSSLDADSIRVDHVLTPKLTVFGRYNRSPSNMEQRAPLLSSARVLSLKSVFSSSVQTATLGATEVINGAVSNEVRVNYSRHSVDLSQVLDDFGGAVPLADATLFPPGYSSANAALLFYIPTAGEYAQGHFGTDAQSQFNAIDNVSLTRGRHQVKFGLDYRWLAPSSSPFAYRQFAQFSGMSAAPGGALSGTAQLAQAGQFQANSLRSQNLSLYAQDTWTAGPRITTTFGVRWDISPPLHGVDAQNDPFTVVGMEQPATMALAPRGTPMYETTYGNVAPRFGLVYQVRETPRWRSTLRTGVGVFYDLGYGSLGGATTYFPYFANKTLAGSSYPLTAPDAAPPAFTTSPPVATIVIADPHLQLPRTYQWNVALEQSLGEAQSVSVTYVGAVGRDLLRATSLFNVNPDFQFVSLTDNSATSDYRALQVQLRRRFSRGVQATASYTLAHSMDDASTDAFATYLNTVGAASASGDRGDSDFDIRHAFTAGFMYVLPSPRSGGVRSIFADWSFDAVAFARSAPPVAIFGALFVGPGVALRPRPNVNPGVPLELFGSQYPGGKIFNPAAFSATSNGQQGNLGRNVLRGFGASQADIALQREFRPTGRMTIRLRVECFNIFNQANFGSPENDLSTATFGYSTRTLANSLGAGGANGGFSPLYQIGGPRSIQLAARLQF
jgi:hypothetical protein